MSRLNIENNPTAEFAASITLDATKLIPADSRHVSRILKKAGLQRAERGYGGYYSFGYRIADSTLSICSGSSYKSDETKALMDQAVAILEDHGLIVAGGGHYPLVLKPVREDEAGLFWYNKLSGSFVQANNTTVVHASRVPAFMAEDAERRRLERVAQRKQKEEREARIARRDALVAALNQAGLDCKAVQSTVGIIVDGDTLEQWLKAEVDVLDSDLAQFLAQSDLSSEKV